MEIDVSRAHPFASRVILAKLNDYSYTDDQFHQAQQRLDYLMQQSVQSLQKSIEEITHKSSELKSLERFELKAIKHCIPLIAQLENEELDLFSETMIDKLDQFLIVAKHFYALEIQDFIKESGNDVVTHKKDIDELLVLVNDYFKVVHEEHRLLLYFDLEDRTSLKRVDQYLIIGSVTDYFEQEHELMKDSLKALMENAGKTVMDKKIVLEDMMKISAVLAKLLSRLAELFDQFDWRLILNEIEDLKNRNTLPEHLKVPIRDLRLHTYKKQNFKLMTYNHFILRSDIASFQFKKK